MKEYNNPYYGDSSTLELYEDDFVDTEELSSFINANQTNLPLVNPNPDDNLDDLSSTELEKRYGLEEENFGDL